MKRHKTESFSYATNTLSQRDPITEPSFSIQSDEVKPISHPTSKQAAYRHKRCMESTIEDLGSHMLRSDSVLGV